jgi:hypothetical protein
VSKKSPAVTSPLGLSLLLAIVSVAAASFLIYYLTAFRTITWWNSSEYSLAAATLGVAHPPGCLVGTLLGWIAVKLAVCGSSAFAVNLLSGLVASLTAVIVGLISGYYLRKNDSPVALSVSSQGLIAASVGAIIGALTLAYALTFWLYSTKFTPYIFTVLFTALIIWAMIRWWGTKAPVWLFVITLLFGLDFSVHRTNLLMAPGLIIWILILYPRTFLAWRTWVYGAAGLIVGLGFHLLVIPMAAAKPFLNGNDPSNFSRFWDYVTLQQLGGGFLVNFFPRKAPFWSVQIMDYLRAFSVNFFSWRGPIPIVGLLPGIFGIVGLIRIWKKNRRLAVGLIVLFLLTSLGAILYFNIPANYFRSLFRHYMPSFVIFAVWIAFGVGSLLMACMKSRRRNRFLVYGLIILLFLSMPGHQILKNYNRLDGSDNYFACDYALNMFNTLPENSILITFGDNDTFPLWYYQIVEGIRPDVTVLNTSLLNTQWFVRQSLLREPDLPLGIELPQVGGLSIRIWPDTTIAIPVTGTADDFNLVDGISLPDSMMLHVPPTLSDQYLLIADQLLLNLVQYNQWQRPIYLSAAGGISWLRDYVQPEGVVNRLTPVMNPPVNGSYLTSNLLERCSYRGYAGDDVFLEGTSRTMALNYLTSFFMCAEAAYESGDQEQLDLVRSKMMQLLPPDRLRPWPEHFDSAIEWLNSLEVKDAGEES